VQWTKGFSNSLWFYIYRNGLQILHKMSAQLAALQAAFSTWTGLSTGFVLFCACRADLTGFAALLLVLAKWVLRP